LDAKTTVIVSLSHSQNSGKYCSLATKSINDSKYKSHQDESHHELYAHKTNRKVGFEVLTAAIMKMAVFWVAVLCSLVEVYLHFRCTCCLHHQGNEEFKFLAEPGRFCPDDGGSKYF
jgi:hypothetical protein